MRSDRILKKLIPQHNSEWLTTPPTPFVTLARAIVGQQVSTKAADAIWGRFAERCGQMPTPNVIVSFTVEDLRAVGLSKRKAEYVLDLAAHFAEQKVQPAAWSSMDDEEIITDLCAIRG